MAGSPKNHGKFVKLKMAKVGVMKEGICEKKISFMVTIGMFQIQKEIKLWK